MRSHALILVGALAGSIAAASCAVVGYDLDGYGPAKGGASNGGGGGSGGSSTVGSASGGGGARCGAGATCSEAPTNGFRGPVALLVDMPSSTCDGDFPTAVFTGGDSPSGAPATCTCSCDTAPCGALAVVTTYTDVACSTGPVGYSVSDDDVCNPNAQPAGVNVFVTPPKTSGACTASAPTVQKPAATFATAIVACAGASGGPGCSGGEACYPTPKAPFDPGLCLYKAGDVACPSGLVKKLYFKSIDDSRSCTACTCGQPAMTCPVAVSLYADNACANLLGTPADAACIALASDWSSAKAKLTSPCPAIDGTPEGGVTGGDPTTFCCDE